MRKEQELLPGSCLSKAKPDELIFVLLGRDVAAPNAIRAWCRERVALCKNKADDPQIVEALACADAMDREREAPMPKRLGPEQVYQCLQCRYTTGQFPVPVWCPGCREETTWGKLYSQLPW